MNVLEFDGAAFDDLAWWVEHDCMKTSDPDGGETNLRLRPRPTESVSINIPVDTLESIRRVASHKDMSEAALLRQYIGQGLREDLSRLYSEREIKKEAVR